MMIASGRIRLKKKTFSKSNLSTQFDISAQAHFDKTFYYDCTPKRTRKQKNHPVRSKTQQLQTLKEKEGKEKTKK